MLAPFLRPLPLIAILRGIRPDDVDGIGDVLVAEGLRVLEVPLNSPEPFTSIGRLAGDARTVGYPVSSVPPPVGERRGMTEMRQPRCPRAAGAAT